MALRYASPEQVYTDLEDYLTTELSGGWGSQFVARSGSSLVAHEVINNSPEGVRQGSSNR